MTLIGAGGYTGRRGEWVPASAGHSCPWEPLSAPPASTPALVPAASLSSRLPLVSSHQAPFPASLRSSVSLYVGRNNFQLLHLCCSPVPSLSHLSSVPGRLLPAFFLPIPGLLRPSSPLSFRGLHFPFCLDLSFLLLPGSCDPGTLSVSLPDLPLMLSILQLSIFCARPPSQSILSGTSPPHRLPLHLSPPFSRLTSLPSLSPSLFTALSTAHFPSPFPRLSHLTPCYSLRALHVQIWTQKPEDTECHILIHWGACRLPLGLPPRTLRTCPPLSEPSIPMILPDSLPRE